MSYRIFMGRRKTSYQHGFRESVWEEFYGLSDDLEADYVKEKTIDEIFKYGVELARSVYSRHQLPTGVSYSQAVFGIRNDTWVPWAQLTKSEMDVALAVDGKILERDLWKRHNFGLGTEPHLAAIVLQVSFDLKASARGGNVDSIAHRSFGLAIAIRNLKELTVKIRGQSVGKLTRQGIENFAHGSEGGKVGGVKRSADSKEKKAAAILMASNILDEEPHLSMRDVADIIASKWDDQRHGPASFESIRGYLKGSNLKG